MLHPSFDDGLFLVIVLAFAVADARGEEGETRRVEYTSCASADARVGT